MGMERVKQNCSLYFPCRNTFQILLKLRYSNKITRQKLNCQTLGIGRMGR